jgi:hypothetical protein
MIVLTNTASVQLLNLNTKNLKFALPIFPGIGADLFDFLFSEYEDDMMTIREHRNRDGTPSPEDRVYTTLTVDTDACKYVWGESEVS